jgi:hypothetical protein
MAAGNSGNAAWQQMRRVNFSIFAPPFSVPGLVTSERAV